MGIVGRELPKLLPGAEPEFFQYEVGSEPHRLMVNYKDQNVWVDIPSDDDSDESMLEICKATAITLGLGRFRRGANPARCPGASVFSTPTPDK